MQFKLMICLGLLVSSMFVLSATAADVELPILADTMFSGHSAEHDTNCGARTSLRVKGYQGIVVFRFDMTAVEGQRAEGATLTAYCKSISGDAADKSNSDKISTISRDWIEGAGNYTPSKEWSTFDSPGKALGDEWADKDYDGLARNGLQINVMDVILGFGGSLLNSEGVWEFRVGEWTDIELDMELAQGLIDGTQYGIVVWRDTIGVNLDLASREDAGGQNAARLVMHTGGLSVAPHAKLAVTWGSIKL